MVHVILAALFTAIAVLNYFDYASTTAVISSGKGHEANPAMAWLMKVAGPYWALYKLVMIPLGWMVWTASATNPLLAIAISAGAAALFTYAVLNNYKILAAL